MISAAIVSALHLLGLGIGLPSIFLRARALKGPFDDAGLKRLFAADSVWGLAAALWIVTGLLRVFAGLEKGADFYLSSHLFYGKMALLVAVILLELWPMVTFIRWRAAHRSGAPIDTSSAAALYRISHIQMGIVVIMVFVAAAMARAIGRG